MWGCFFALHYQFILKKVTSWPTIVKLIPFAMVVFCLLSKKLLPGAGSPFRDHFMLAFFGSFGLVTNVSIALVIIISIHSPGTLYFKLLNSRPLNFIGKLSYSIYLWQQLFFSKNVGFFSTFPLNILFIFIAALLSYYCIEKPFLKLKDRFSNRKTKKDISPARTTAQPSVV
jgi:peptidoglycan/LPS O-acetylase OafA/YrhL